MPRRSIERRRSSGPWPCPLGRGRRRPATVACRLHLAGTLCFCSRLFTDQRSCRLQKPKQQTRSKPEGGRGGSGAARSRPGGSGGRREREPKPVNLSITVRGGGVSKARVSKRQPVSSRQWQPVAVRAASGGDGGRSRSSKQSFSAAASCNSRVVQYGTPAVGLAQHRVPPHVQQRAHLSSVLAAWRARVQGGGRGSGGGGRGGRDPAADRQSAEQRRAALEGSAKWTHDRFDGGRGDGTRRRDPRQPSRLGTKMYVARACPISSNPLFPGSPCPSPSQPCSSFLSRQCCSPPSLPIPFTCQLRGSCGVPSSVFWL